MKPKIVSLGIALPPFSYSQRQVFTELKYPEHFWRIFRDSRIERRHFSIPLERLIKLSFQEQQQTYQREALKLSKEAIISCLDGRDPKEIGCLVYCSCTGIVPGPTVGDFLLRELGLLPDTRIINDAFQGCEGGGFPGLAIATDFTMATGKPALVVATELCGLTYYPEPDGKPNPENDYQCLRANAIFGEASSAALVGYDDDWRHPVIVDQESCTDPNYIGDLGYQWRDGRLMVLLSKRVPKVAPLVVKPAVEAVLGRQSLKVDDINWWIIHAAGMAVISNIQRALGIAQGKLELALEVLKGCGNCSSSTVGLVGKRLMSENIKVGDWVVVVTVGPGMRGGATLLRFA